MPETTRKSINFIDSSDYLETIEYANILLYWLTSNIEDNCKLSESTKKKLLFDINQLKNLLDRATGSNEPTIFLYRFKAYLIEINTIFDVSDSTSNELVTILLRTLKTRFNRLSRDHDYKEIFVSSKDNKDDAVYKLINGFTDETWEIYKKNKKDIHGYKEALSTPALILTYASWISQNVTTALFIQSSFVFLNLCNPTTAAILGFSISFTLLATNFDLIYKNLSYFFTHAGLSKGWDNFFYDPITTLKNLSIMACSIAAASTIVCFAGTMPTTLPYLNLVLGITSAVSSSIFFYQDLSNLINIDTIFNKFYRLYEIILIEPFEGDDIFQKISNFILNLFVTISGFTLFYYTGKTIFDSSKDVLLNHYALNIFSVSKYAQDLFLSCSMLGLETIAASNIFLMFTSIRHYLGDLINHYQQHQEETLSIKELTNYSSDYNNQDIENPNINKPLSSTQIKEEISNNLEKFQRGLYYQLVGYSINKKFAHYVASNLKPENSKNANAISRGLIGHMEPQSGILFIDMAKFFIEKMFESGAVEHGLFNSLKFKN